MSENQNITIIYTVLQILVVFALIIMCITCLYKRARAEEIKSTRLRSSQIINVKSNPDKIKELENRIQKLEIRL